MYIVFYKPVFQTAKHWDKMYEIRALLFQGWIKPIGSAALLWLITSTNIIIMCKKYFHSRIGTFAIYKLVVSEAKHRKKNYFLS